MCQECVINPFSLVTVSNTVHEQRTDPEIVQKCVEWVKMNYNHFTVNVNQI